MSEIDILSDDGPDTPDTPRLRILGCEDYYVSVIAPPDEIHGASVRFCTSGARDYRRTYLVAALFHYATGNPEQAMACARNFIETAEDGS